MTWQLLILLFATGTPPQLRFEWPQTPQAQAAQHHVRFLYQLKNQSQQAAHDVQFLVYAPVVDDAFQHCALLETNRPAQRHTDEHGNQYLAYNVPTIPPYGAVLIQVSATLTFATQPKDMPPPGPETLAPQPFIQADHPLIQTHAAGLKGADTAETAQKIYNFVRTTVSQSGYTANDRGALAALEQGSGDCSEMAYLFIALARALKLPARYHSGYVITDDGLINAAAYHNWASFYDGRTWRIADPQGGRLDPNQTPYLLLTTSRPGPKHPLAGAHRFKVNHPNIVATMPLR